MKLGEIWRYKGNFPENEYDSQRWCPEEECGSDDPYWFMEKVRISKIFEEYGFEMVSMESLEGDVPMEAVHTCPKVTFLKEYEKDYDASR